MGPSLLYCNTCIWPLTSSEDIIYDPSLGQKTVVFTFTLATNIENQKLKRIWMAKISSIVRQSCRQHEIIPSSRLEWGNFRKHTVQVNLFWLHVFSIESRSSNRRTINWHPKIGHIGGGNCRNRYMWTLQVNKIDWQNELENITGGFRGGRGGRMPP